ncbi:MAG: hypothetical protein ABF633_17715 [Clostridium sp.]|uniref:hypothetical protein n=1 Tax=Clostridium sp. TaxID=1506 RepID=UPI0039EBDB3B
MKKKRYLFLVIALLSITLLAGCAENKELNANKNVANPDSTVQNATIEYGVIPAVL